jgi:hypothetical protein
MYPDMYITAFAVALQLMAAFFAWRIFLFNRMDRGWIAIVFAMVLMAARRVLNLFLQAGFISPMPIFSEMDTWIQLLISVSVVTGMYSMYKSFEGFAIVDAKATKKVAEFSCAQCEKPAKAKRK